MPTTGRKNVFYLLRFMNIRAGEMARRLGVSRMHVGRLAKAGAIPNSRRTSGGHWYWFDTKPLRRWLNRMEFGRSFRESRLSTAYLLGYEKKKVAPRSRPQRLRPFRWRPTELNITIYSLDAQFRKMVEAAPPENWSDYERLRLIKSLKPFCILRERLKTIE